MPATTKSYETLGGVAPFDTSVLRYPPLILQAIALDSITYITGTPGTLTKPTLVYQDMNECSDIACMRWFYYQHPAATVQALRNLTGNGLESGAVTLVQAPMYEIVFGGVNFSSSRRATDWDCRTYEGYLGDLLRVCMAVDDEDNVLFSIDPPIEIKHLPKPGT